MQSSSEPALDPLVARGANRMRAVAPGAVDVPGVEWAFFASRLAPETLVPRTAFIVQGRPTDRLYFIVDGLVRLFRKEGRREITLGFDCEDRFTGAYDSVVTASAATIGVETLEPTQLLSFDRRTLEELFQRHPCWERFGRLQAERGLLHKIDKELRIRGVSAEGRYRRLVAEQSWILERVPQYHVASYLGIAPETLSRIRARL
jgi:CRP-like cAMP-binding protein